MKPPTCDGNDCPDLPPGAHSADCLTVTNPGHVDDIAWFTALEDGHTHPTTTARSAA